MKQQLEAIFSPGSVALIGASASPGSVGNVVWKNILEAGYRGKLYPVNPKYSNMDGYPVYKSVLEIDADVDLAIVTTPAATVPEIIKMCGKKKIPGMVILSAGFKEVGKDGQKLFEQIQALIQRYNIRAIGPNCVGIIHPHIGLNASFSKTNALPGKLALISQSGAICVSILDWARDQNVGFSHFISLGSMVDVSYHDLIDYLANDPETNAILMYMESLDHARRFMSAARAFANTKPIIVLKAGKSQAGAKAALSHTGSLTGNDAVFDVAFQRAGIIRVDTISQLFSCAQAIAMQPLPKGDRLAILTNAGGPAILATDYLSTNGGTLAELSEPTLKKLDGMLSAAWSHGNPVDILGDGTPEQFTRALEILLKDEGVDAVLTIFTTQGIVDANDAALAVIEGAQSSQGKTVLATWMGERDVQRGRDTLEQGNIPVYRYPETAVDVFLKMHKYKRNLEVLYETPPSSPFDFSPDREKAKKIIRAAWKAGRNTLSEQEGAQLMKCYDIPVLESYMATSEEEAAKFAEKLSFPIVMKISGPEMVHKTELGGVKLNINNVEEARKAYREIIQSVSEKKPGAQIDGVIMLPFVKKRYELFIGANTDPIFGPVVVFGMGGVAVEVFRDQAIGLPPLNMRLAERMIRRTKIYQLLKGFRNMPAVDLESIQFLLVRFAYLVMEHPEIQEMDINPFAVDETGGKVLDVKIILKNEGETDMLRPYQHLVISPYPEQYQRDIKLNDGTKVHLRPVRPEDEPLEKTMFEVLSRETVYYRFFGYIPKVTHKMLSRYTHIDYDREMNIIATIEDEQGNEEMIGMVHIVGDAWRQKAEYAIVIADEYQNKGLGTIMTNYILDIAREQGYKKVYANLLKMNTGMKVLLEQFGFSVRSDDNATYYAEMKLE